MRAASVITNHLSFNHILHAESLITLRENEACYKTKLEDVLWEELKQQQKNTEEYDSHIFHLDTVRLERVRGLHLKKHSKQLRPQKNVVLGVCLPIRFVLRHPTAFPNGNLGSIIVTNEPLLRGTLFEGVMNFKVREKTQNSICMH